MASGSYQFGAMKIHDGTIDVDTTVIKLMLVKTTHTFNPDQQAVDTGGAGDLNGDEIVATNYTGGHGGSGRKTVTITLAVNDANNRLEMTFNDQTWTSIGGATNDTIGGVAAFVPGGANDTQAIPLWYWDVTDTPTNGGNITVDFAAANGNVQVNCG